MEIVLLQILTCAAVGRLIDLLIGKSGQVRVREFLEGWWYKFDDVRWNNFGRKEALFTVDLLHRWFGRCWWGLQRIRWMLLICSFLYFYFWVPQILLRWPVNWVFSFKVYSVIPFAISCISMSLS